MLSAAEFDHYDINSEIDNSTLPSLFLSSSFLPFFLSFFPNLCKVKEDADGREGAKLTSRDISEADIKVRILQKFEADESHAASNIAGMAMGLAMIFRFSGPLPCAT